jgi:hypothetical protein
VQGGSTSGGQFLPLHSFRLAQGESFQLGGLHEEAHHVGRRHLLGAETPQALDRLGLKRPGLPSLTLGHFASGVLLGLAGLEVEVTVPGLRPLYPAEGAGPARALADDGRGSAPVVLLGSGTQGAPGAEVAVGGERPVRPGRFPGLLLPRR